MQFITCLLSISLLASSIAAMPMPDGDYSPKGEPLSYDPADVSNVQSEDVPSAYKPESDEVPLDLVPEASYTPSVPLRSSFVDSENLGVSSPPNLEGAVSGVPNAVDAQDLYPADQMSLN